MIFGAESVRAILAGTKTQTRRVITPDNAQFGAWGRQFFAHADFARAWRDGIGSGAEYLHVPVHQSANGCVWCETMGCDGVVDRLRPKIAPARCYDQKPSTDRRDPYTPPASQLWVKETAYISPAHFARDAEATHDDGRVVQYVASCPDGDAAEDYGIRRTPSIFMPRWASRITLEVTEVRAQRVQDITLNDAILEGVPYTRCTHLDQPPTSLACFDCMNTGVLDNPVKTYAALWDSLNAKRGHSWESNPFVWAIGFNVVDGKEHQKH
jgi:hypothetical protein